MRVSALLRGRSTDTVFSMSVTPEQRANPSLGWKIHLNFDVDDAAVADRVRAYAANLEARGEIATFKIGDGGGKATGENRKEATLYCGSLENIMAVGQAIEHDLATILLPPDRETMSHDLPLTARGLVWGRFTAMYQPTDKYHQYGAHGIPYLKDDMAAALWGTPDLKATFHRALNELSTDFGELFAGPQREITTLLARGALVDEFGTERVFGWSKAADVIELPIRASGPDLGLR